MKVVVNQGYKTNRGAIFSSRAPMIFLPIGKNVQIYQANEKSDPQLVEILRGHSDRVKLIQEDSIFNQKVSRVCLNKKDKELILARKNSAKIYAFNIQTQTYRDIYQFSSRLRRLHSIECHSQQKKILLFVTVFQSIYIIDIDKKSQIYQVNAPSTMTQVKYFSTTNLLTYSDNTGKIYTSNLALNQKQPKTSIHHWHAHPVRSIAYSQSMDYLYSGGQEGVIVLWQLKSQKKTFIAHLGSPIIQLILNKQDDNQQTILCILQNNKVFLINTSNYQTQLVTQNYSPIKEKCKNFCYDQITECWISPQSNGWIQFLSFDNGHSKSYNKRVDKVFDYNIVGRNFVSEIQHSQIDQPKSQVQSICVIDKDTLITLQRSMIPLQNVQRSILKIWDRDIIQNQIKLIYTYQKSTDDQDSFLQPENRIQDIFTHPILSKKFPHFIQIRDKSFNIWKKSQKSNWSICGYGNCRRKRITASTFSWIKPNQNFDQQLEALRQSSQLEDLQGIKKEQQKLKGRGGGSGSNSSQQYFFLLAFETIITRWDIAITKTKQEEVKYILSQQYCQPQIQGDILGLALSPNNKFLAVLNQRGLKVLRFNKAVQLLWEVQIQFGYEMINSNGSNQEQFAILSDKQKLLQVYDFTSSIPIKKISLKNTQSYGSQIVNAQLISGGIDQLFVFYDSCEIQHFNIQYEKKRMKSLERKTHFETDYEQQKIVDITSDDIIYKFVESQVAQNKNQIERELRSQIFKLQKVRNFNTSDRNYTKQRKFYQNGDFSQDLQKYLSINNVVEYRQRDTKRQYTVAEPERNLIIDTSLPKKQINKIEPHISMLNQKLKDLIRDEMKNLI